MLSALLVVTLFSGPPAIVEHPVPWVQRIEMQETAIRGQLTRVGEVQLLERKPAEMRSLVKLRASFRNETILGVFPESPLKP